MNIFKTYWYSYLKYRLTGNMDILISYYKKKGMVIGNNCKIYSGIATPESYLIKLGNNITIATGVKFITHDNSISKIYSEFSDIFGKIEIGDNCFIGAYSIIMPGVVLGKNTIVAAGSVVTKSFLGDEVIGGVPAKKICSIDNYKSRIKQYGMNVIGLSEQEKKELVLNGKLIER